MRKTVALVSWTDSSLQNGQVDKDGFPEPENIRSIGFLVHQEDSHVVLAREDMNDPSGVHQGHHPRSDGAEMTDFVTPDGGPGIPPRHLRSVGEPPTADAAPQPEATASPPPAQVEHPTTGDVDQHTPAAGTLSPLAAGGSGNALLANTLLVLGAIDEAFASARSAR